MIQFGQIVVSKRVQQMVASWDNVEYIEVNPTMDSMNPTGKTTMHMQASIDMFTHLFAVKNEFNAYLNRWQRLEVAGKAQLSTAIEEPSCFEGRTIRELQQHIPDNSQVLVANSMTVRDFDYFGFLGSPMPFFTVIVVLMVSMVQFPLCLDLQRIISLHIS